MWPTLEIIFGIVFAPKKYPTKYVTVTGGEPLAQQSCLKLLAKLCNFGYDVSLETSGAINVSNVDKRVKKIIDIKTPGSAEENKNKFENLKHLTTKDEIKFVICDQSDYVWAKKNILEKNMANICEIIFSPAHESIKPKNLANWILKDQLNVRMQIQLHKYLWGDRPGKWIKIFYKFFRKQTVLSYVGWIHFLKIRE